ncbi:MAG: DUF2752 domain-containing protein [candidate division KSB1 bacterium]|nr:DUF2752 domain-containing protein [candidate division KSB1 bacterium]MDZ7288110.1 DUF2752 domain-containing protein [candidate division KSB1 bacterium]MDZ7300211.1 DUF2752 domain-containing protein [candidate division KSB1 bacterium]MDZ7305782.1 DUF2752 domain-containing protein [candidate division KSB1 bacterium]MDZ7351211.1 DUF2752 domain-containing protein [candidate division KSB1 bacterium]
MLLLLITLLGWWIAGWAAPLAAALPPCLLHRLLHLPCPTCGSTRALLALGRGEIAVALAANPLLGLFALGSPAAAVMLLVAAGAGRDLRRLWSPQNIASWRRLALAALVLNWIYLLARASLP